MKKLVYQERSSQGKKRKGKEKKGKLARQLKNLLAFLDASDGTDACMESYVEC